LQKAKFVMLVIIRNL